MTPLHYAAKYAQYEAARTLINMNADPTIKGDDGCLPLHFAVKYRPEAFRPLVKSQYDPENEIPNENDFEGKPEIRNKEEDFLQTLEFLIQARALCIYLKLLSKNSNRFETETGINRWIQSIHRALDEKL